MIDGTATAGDQETTLLEQAAAWKFFHDLFCGPSEAQWEYLNRAPVIEAWKRLASTGDRPCPAQLPLPAEYREYEQVYLSTFEVGAPHPPCPLIESHWNKRHSVPTVLRENLLFYTQFGLQLRSSVNETADHLRHQLEFLHYLCRLEATCVDRHDRATDARQIAHGRQDYLERHIASWVPAAAESLVQTAPDTWPSYWMNLLSAYCID